jgi:hypothetical protein
MPQPPQLHVAYTLCEERNLPQLLEGMADVAAAAVKDTSSIPVRLPSSGFTASSLRPFKSCQHAASNSNRIAAAATGDASDHASSVSSSDGDDGRESHADVDMRSSSASAPVSRTAGAAAVGVATAGDGGGDQTTAVVGDAAAIIDSSSSSSSDAGGGGSDARRSLHSTDCTAADTRAFFGAARSPVQLQQQQHEPQHEKEQHEGRTALALGLGASEVSNMERQCVNNSVTPPLGSFGAVIHGLPANDSSDEGTAVGVQVLQQLSQASCLTTPAAATAAAAEVTAAVAMEQQQQQQPHHGMQQQQHEHHDQQQQPLADGLNLPSFADHRQRLLRAVLGDAAPEAAAVDTATGAAAAAAAASSAAVMSTNPLAAAQADPAAAAAAAAVSLHAAAAAAADPVRSFTMTLDVRSFQAGRRLPVALASAYVQAYLPVELLGR